MLWIPLLLLACGASALASARLCLAAVRAADPGFRLTDRRGRPGARPLTLAETAFLSGGPARVVELTLVAMARRGRLLLAHTGWATAVVPDSSDPMERAVLGALGPEGQYPVAGLRTRLADSEAVRALAARLTAAGLAVPEEIRSRVYGAMRQVRASVLLVLFVGLGTLLGVPHPGHSTAELAGWFGLPLLLVAGCALIGRIEVLPYARWASPLGEEALEQAAADADTALAVHGLRVVHEPQLRAAFTTVASADTV
ncbi:TIGR04222 domain-containing membrane protein [Streptomyces sp. NPDC049954]|uniref:TIGR04222 domain-containing membrane protein n=1 Tax=Streptomyces sp. NPDC049954 TaxID=3155779 RepID=UPI003423A297